MPTPAARTGWYYTTITAVPNSHEVDLDLDLGFDIHLQTRLRLDGVMAPDARSDDSAERAAGQAVCRFIGDWANDQPDGRPVAHIARTGDRGCTGTIWSADGECLNELLVDDGHALGSEGEY